MQQHRRRLAAGGGGAPPEALLLARRRQDPNGTNNSTKAAQNEASADEHVASSIEANSFINGVIRRRALAPGQSFTVACTLGSEIRNFPRS